MAKERTELENVKFKNQFQRSLQNAEEKVKEQEMTIDDLRDRLDRAQHNAQESQYKSKKDIETLEKRSEDSVSSFERQLRELRSQLSIKNKDIANLRDDNADLEQRSATKQSELRTVKTQL